ncbi:hypothetical protein DL96DRAFT_1463603 [Flagelloscypha sp. PMI_526]|nr:hypothetical protein DL96DRAFT_1463603 [Flagelloscypha sp. PMI_526]
MSSSSSSGAATLSTNEAKRISAKSFSSSATTTSLPESGWGSNFWVTLTDPTTGTQFYANPSTGQTAWDPPVGTFVLPLSEEGEWWELTDESRGIPYYHQSKTKQTTWERPDGFVIPLGILQNTALGRKVSLNASKRISLVDPDQPSSPQRPSNRISRSSSKGQVPATSSNSKTSPSSHNKTRLSRRSTSTDFHNLSPIPGSPNASGVSAPTTPVSSHQPLPPNKKKDSPGSRSVGGSLSRNRSKSSSYLSHKPPQPQSLSAAVEMLASSQLELQGSPGSTKSPSNGHIRISTSPPETSNAIRGNKGKHPPSPRRPVPAAPGGPSWAVRNASSPSIIGREISGPVPNRAATMEMSPVKHKNAGKPILVPSTRNGINGNSSTTSLPAKTRPILPQDLVSDIQQFSESDYAKQYFSTHRRGFIFKRKVPVAQMMQWQKAPLTSPLLTLKRELNKDAVKVFRIIQHIMGDRERDKSMNVRAELIPSTVGNLNGSNTSLHNVGSSALLEEQRWILSEGISHGELRDEIYCQIMKQLTGNPSQESVFKGWQLLCVTLSTFPPSKNFETYLRSFMQQRTSHSEARVDVMAKYCLRRIEVISRKGPKGKPPTVAEIEIAADAAFNPSTFGESLDAIMRLQERSYPHQKVPVILPFLADGILALGGNRSEGIFRVPGDGDSVSALKLGIDQGFYTLPDGVSDPHVLASLMKLWLRELCDPLVPEEMYNECISHSKDSEACLGIVQTLPTINRRVIIFVISFLQLFLEEKTQAVTKMTPANLALVMAPNILRCNSDSMSVVFTNAQFEQEFVFNLLMNMDASSMDPAFSPVHGQGSISTPSRFAPTTRRS